MKTKKLSTDVTRKYLIIKALAAGNKPNLNDIVAYTKIPRVSVQRQIVDLRNSYFMDIQYVRPLMTSWKDGYYEIMDWGVVNKERFLDFMEHSFPYKK